MTAVVKDYHFKPFPSKNQFAESFDVEDGYLYAPFNNVINESNTPPTVQERSGLYRCKLTDITASKNSNDNIFEFVVGFPDNEELYYGSKYKQNVFICCVTTNNSIYVANIATNTSESIDVNKYGLPNDVCFDSIDSNIIYVAIISNFQTYSGLLIKIDLRNPNNIEVMSGDSNDAICKIKLNFATGVNCVDDFIYFASIDKIYIVNKNDPTKYSIALNGANVRHSFFDNVSIRYNELSKENVITIAIFDYNQMKLYALFQNNFLYSTGVFLLSCFLGTPGKQIYY